MIDDFDQVFTFNFCSPSLIFQRCDLNIHKLFPIQLHLDAKLLSILASLVF